MKYGQLIQHGATVIAFVDSDTTVPPEGLEPDVVALTERMRGLACVHRIPMGKNGELCDALRINAPAFLLYVDGLMLRRYVSEIPANIEALADVFRNEISDARKQGKQ